MDLTAFKTHEPASVILFESTHFTALVLGLMTYGVTTVVCMTCIFYLVTTSKTAYANAKWVFFVILLFSGATLNVVGDILAHIDGWVLYRGYPGGPSAFFLHVSVLGAADWTTYLMGILVDALLVHRVYMLYGTWFVIALPLLMLLAATILGPFFVLQLSGQNHDWFAKHTLDFTIPYFSVELSLNILLTLLLVTRLLHMSRTVEKALGRKHGRMYTGIAQMIVESSAPYAVVSVVLLVLFIKQNLGANVLIPVYVQVQCMTPTLIILRVCLGRAWDRNTLSRVLSSKTADWEARVENSETKQSVLQFRHTTDDDTSTAPPADEQLFNDSRATNVQALREEVVRQRA